MADKKDNKEKKSKKVKKVKSLKKENAKKASKLALKSKMIEVLLTLDPAMKEKKILKRAGKATKILGKGIKKKGGSILVAEVMEVKG